MTQTLLSLYEQDFNLWIEEVVTRLKQRDFDNLDLENLIEEIDSLGRRDRREVERRLQVLLSHCLKRSYVTQPENFRGWEITIRDQRTELKRLLKQSPSLKTYLLEVLDEVGQLALAEVREDYPDAELPTFCPYPANVDLLLSSRFWQVG